MEAFLTNYCNFATSSTKTSTLPSRVNLIRDGSLNVESLIWNASVDYLIDPELYQDSKSYTKLKLERGEKDKIMVPSPYDNHRDDSFYDDDEEGFCPLLSSVTFETPIAIAGNASSSIAKFNSNCKQGSFQTTYFPRVLLNGGISPDFLKIPVNDAVWKKSANDLISFYGNLGGGSRTTMLFSYLPVVSERVSIIGATYNDIVGSVYFNNCYKNKKKFSFIVSDQFFGLMRDTSQFNRLLEENGILEVEKKKCYQDKERFYSIYIVSSLYAGENFYYFSDNILLGQSFDLLEENWHYKEELHSLVSAFKPNTICYFLYTGEDGTRSTAETLLARKRYDDHQEFVVRDPGHGYSYHKKSISLEQLLSDDNFTLDIIDVGKNCDLASKRSNRCFYQISLFRYRPLIQPTVHRILGNTDLFKSFFAPYPQDQLLLDPRHLTVNDVNTTPWLTNYNYYLTYSMIGRSSFVSGVMYHTKGNSYVHFVGHFVGAEAKMFDIGLKAGWRDHDFMFQCYCVGDHQFLILWEIPPFYNAYNRTMEECRRRGVTFAIDHSFLSPKAYPILQMLGNFDDLAIIFNPWEPFIVAHNIGQKVITTPSYRMLLTSSNNTVTIPNEFITKIKNCKNYDGLTLLYSVTSSAEDEHYFIYDKWMGSLNLLNENNIMATHVKGEVCKSLLEYQFGNFIKKNDFMFNITTEASRDLDFTYDPDTKDIILLSGDTHASVFLKLIRGYPKFPKINYTGYYIGATYRKEIGELLINRSAGLMASNTLPDQLESDFAILSSGVIPDKVIFDRIIDHQRYKFVYGSNFLYNCLGFNGLDKRLLPLPGHDRYSQYFYKRKKLQIDFGFK